MDQMIYYYPEGHAEHYEAGHPERPERVEVIRSALQQLGWWDEFPVLRPVKLDEDILTRVHTPAYLNVLELSCRRGGHLDADTYTTPASWDLALATAGGAVAVAQAVWRGLAYHGFALTRPPGHHATRGQGMGFCLLNNVSLAAEYLIRSENATRLVILDFDLHHGNGTQDIFYQRDDVFYISTHQSPFYPGTGMLDETGRGTGIGYTANFPFPPGSGDTAFLTALEEIILPLLDRYQPQMILVSYGFDVHWSDPLGHLLVSASGYSGLISRLSNWADSNCGGRMVLFLEGGYNLDAAAACSCGVVAAMLDQKFTDPLGNSPYAEGNIWYRVLEQAYRLWEI